jgi:hypothetical protein
MRRKFVYFPIRCCGYWKIFRETSSPAAPPDQGETPTIPAPAPAPSEDPKQKLTQLKEMHDEGLITEAEYESKKAEIQADI